MIERERKRKKECKKYAVTDNEKEVSKRDAEKQIHTKRSSAQVLYNNNTDHALPHVRLPYLSLFRNLHHVVTDASSCCS